MEARMVRAGALAVAAALLVAAATAGTASAEPRQAAIGISASLRFLAGDDLRDAVDSLRDAGVRYSR